MGNKRSGGVQQQKNPAAAEAAEKRKPAKGKAAPGKKGKEAYDQVYQVDAPKKGKKRKGGSMAITAGVFAVAAVAVAVFGSGSGTGHATRKTYSRAEIDDLYMKGLKLTESARDGDKTKDYERAADILEETFQAIVGKRAEETFEKTIEKAARAKSRKELAWLTKAFDTYKSNIAPGHEILDELFRRLAYNYAGGGDGGGRPEMVDKVLVVFFLTTRNDSSRIRHEHAKALWGIAKFKEALEAETVSAQLKEKESGKPNDWRQLALTWGLLSALHDHARYIGTALLKEYAKYEQLEGRAAGRSKQLELLTQIEKRCGKFQTEHPSFAKEQYDVMDNSWLRSVVAQCIIHQNVINGSVAAGSDINAMTRTVGLKPPYEGLTPLLYTAAYGELSLVKEVLIHKPETRQVTPYHQTALHLAAQNGHVSVISTLVEAGVPTGQLDKSGRTAADVACLFPWSAEAASAFGTSLEKMCKKANKRLKKTAEKNSTRYAEALKVDSLATQLQRAEESAKGDVGGSWLSPPVQKPAQCDVDVRVGLAPLEFLNDYFSVNRPVLIRGGLAGKEWDRLRAKWARSKFQREYAQEPFLQESIPYGASYGIPSNHSDIQRHLDYMAELHTEQSKPGVDVNADFTSDSPRYIFLAYDPSGVLMKDYKVPKVIKKASEIDMFPINPNPQFFIGPARSGAPFHVHAMAFNVLVYGRKRWLLRPPPISQYNTRHPLKTFEEFERDDLRKIGVQNCIQESGDILFVPDGWGHSTMNLAESVGWATEMRGWSGWM